MRALRFFDDRDVLARLNVVRRVHPPRKHPANPVMKPETPLERGAHGWAWPTVLYDEEDRLFKAWYEVVGPKTFGAFAVSEDGIAWHRPHLRLFTWKGSKRNNIFYRGVIRWPHAICPCVIKRAPGDWHMYYWDALAPTGPRGVIHFTSDDGLRWRRAEKNPVVQTPVDRTQSGGCEDVLRVSYDAPRRRFLLSQRTLPLENLEKPLLQETVPLGMTQRRVSICESRDGETFSPMRTVLVPCLNDPADLQFYGLSPFRHENAYLAYLLRFWTQRRRMDVELAFSRDAKTWIRVAPGVAYIPNGPLGSWDCGLIHCNSSGVRVGEKLYIYYYGTNSDHAGGTVDKQPLRTGLCLAVADAERIVSVRAGATAGSVLLGPVRLARGAFALNADARRGEVRLALRRPDTYEELPGFGAKEALPLKADARAHAPAWQGGADPATLRDKDVLLHVHLQNAEVFSVSYA